MPLKLVPPIIGRTPYYWVRGTYLGVYVERSTQAGKQQIAQQALRRIEHEIERGIKQSDVKTFASAASSYMRAGGENIHLTPLLKYFGNAPLHKIDQAAIDQAADKIYPHARPATRNRQVYTPISAVLKHAGVDKKIRRPKGSRGGKRTAWLEQPEAFRLLEHADKVNQEFGLMCWTLLYTGMRLSEGLNLQCEQVKIKQRFAYVPDTKTGVPRAVFLPPFLLKKLKRHPRGLDRKGRVFRFHKGGRLYKMLKLSTKKASIDLPNRNAFHIFRHTFATWMRQHGKLDGIGLIRTGAWADLESVERYAHSAPSVEARAAALLPTPRSRVKSV